MVVSTSCALRPAPSAAGLSVWTVGASKRWIPASDSNGCIPSLAGLHGRSTCPDFRLFPIALRIVFSMARHCYLAGGFSLALARHYIVIGVTFSIADRLYFVRSLRPRRASQGADA